MTFRCRNARSLMLAWLVAICGSALAQQPWPADQAIATVDGKPVWVGELRLVLADRLGDQAAKDATGPLQQATALLLVRRHLALNSLRQLGGQRLDAIIARRLKSDVEEAQRLGTDLETLGRSKGADEASLRAHLTWQIAWSQYVSRRLTEENLRKYFRRHRTRYDGTRWEVSQIFLPRVSDHPQAEIAQLDAIAAEIRESPNPSEAFADAARRHSLSGSASKGGMIGWVDHDGDLPRELMSTIRQTQAGALSDPIVSSLGTHLVFVHRLDPGSLEFDELTDQSAIRRDAATALFDSLVRKQQDASIVWRLDELRPPEAVTITPAD